LFFNQQNIKEGQMPNEAGKSLKRLRRENKRLRRQKRLLEAILRSSHDAIVVTDRKGKIVFFNGGAEKITGFDKEQVLGTNALDLFYTDLGGKAGRLISAELKKNRRVSNWEICLKTSLGELIPVLLTVDYVYDQGGKVSRVIGIAKDIREIRQIRQQLEILALTDDLTRLGNKRFFNRRLKEEVIRAERFDRPLSLIILDLDNLKTANDSRGHLYGDEMLKKTVAVVKKAIRATDVPARVGGDEFCVILPETDGDGAVKVANKLLDVARRISKSKTALTFSLGVATLFPADKMSERELLKRADRALYKAKELGRNCICVFVDKLPHKVEE
jgi:diguanylate cyclase (GGDEF)-like protein/PAS domain S-box-containing protein